MWERAGKEHSSRLRLYMVVDCLSNNRRHMERSMIRVENLTMVYPGGKGIFDIDFTVRKGSVTGYLGPNGSGKTTTVRALLGFMLPQKGSCSIDGMDCFLKAPSIQKHLGYLPGEISFIDGMRGDKFLDFMMNMRRAKDKKRMQRLLEMFELDPSGQIRKFSKGMKQKLGIVVAFMNDPDVLILDEPSSGLDPLMQARFIELIREEKSRGKTILLSSHIFDEVEKTCDEVLIIRDGRIAQQADVSTLRKSHLKAFIVETLDVNFAESSFKNAGFIAKKAEDSSLEVFVPGDSVNIFIKTLSTMPIADLRIKEQTIEDAFMHFYGNQKEEGRQ